MKLRLIPIAFALIAGLAFGQQPLKKEAPKQPAKPAPGTLEDTLDKALRNSADIKAAEAKVLEAEAEANRVRSQILTRATTLHTNLHVAKRMLAVAEEMFEKTKAGMERGISSQGDLLATQSVLEKARGEVEILETELKSLRGEFAIKNPLRVGGTLDKWNSNGRIIAVDNLASPIRLDFNLNQLAEPTVESSMTDRVRKLLEQTIEESFAQSSVAETVQKLLDFAKSDVPLRITADKEKENLKFSLTGKLPVGAWLQAIEDSDPTLRLVIRDYGLLLTTIDRVPDGAVRVADFWKKMDPARKSPPTKK